MKFTDEMLAELVALKNDGWALPAIIREFERYSNCTPYILQREIAGYLNPKRHKPAHQWTEEMDAELLARYEVDGPLPISRSNPILKGINDVTLRDRYKALMAGRAKALDPSKSYNPDWLVPDGMKERAMTAFLDGVPLKQMAALFRVSITTIEAYARQCNKDAEIAGARKAAKMRRSVENGKKGAALKVAIPKTETPEQMAEACERLAEVINAQGGHDTIGGLIMLVRKKYPAMHDLSQEAVALGLYERAKQGIAA